MSTPRLLRDPSPHDRRAFLRSATALSTLAALPLSSVLSACAGDSSRATESSRERELRSEVLSPLVEALKKTGVYTAESAGPWKGKEGTHVPTVSKASTGLLVETTHPQAPDDDVGHYITAHFVEGEDGTVFDFVAYTRGDAAGVTATLFVPSSYTSELRVYQHCTKHDLWMASFAQG